MADLLRRHFSPETKLAILKKHLVDKTPVSRVCDEHRIQVSLFYWWQKQLFENGRLAFENGRGQKRTDDAKQKTIDTLEAKVQRKDSVIAELMEEREKRFLTPLVCTRDLRFSGAVPTIPQSPALPHPHFPSES